MLVLTRRIGETLMIGPNIRVTVLGINGPYKFCVVASPRRSR